MPTVAQSDFADALVAGKSYAPRTFREWIETELIIPDGPYRGERFRISRQPAHGPFIDAVDNPEWGDLVFTAVTQFGKSLIAHVCPILYHTCELGQSLTWALPTADMADVKWSQDFRPVMEANPRLRRLLPRRGSGSRGGKVRDMIVLGNGAIIKIQSVGTDDSAKGGFTSPIMAATEAAGFSKSGAASVESDPLRQARARQRAYKRSLRRSYVEGTLTLDDELPWTLRQESTRSQLVAPCPHCRQYVHPGPDELKGWKEAKTEVQAIKRSHWVCPKCKRKITEPQRQKSLLKCTLVHDGQRIDTEGNVTGTPPESTRLWYHATPFFNLLLEPGDIGAEEWSTEQIPDDTPERIAAEKERAQFRWAQTYRPPQIEGQIELDRNGISGRRNELAGGQLYDDTSLLAIAYDTGDRRGWFAALASRPNGELYVPIYGDFDVYSDKARPDIAIQSALESQLPFLKAGLPKASGGTLVAHAVGCDAGHRSEATWGFTKTANERQRLNQWVMAMRGRGESQMEARRFNCPKGKSNSVRKIDPDRQWYIEWVKRSNVFELHFDADISKLRVQHGLTLPLHAPGSISLHAGNRRTHSRIARHCTNERLIWEILPRVGKKARWHRFGDNHLLDCLGMAYVMLCRLGYQPPPLPKVTDDGTDTPKPLDKPTTEQIQKPKPKQKAKPKPAADPRDRVRKWLKSLS